MILYIDFETRSTVDLQHNGLGRYAADPLTDILCYAYAVDDGPVISAAPVKGILPPPPGWEKATIVAHNAQFELALWNGPGTSRYKWPTLKPEQMICTMARAYAMGLPGSLDNAAGALGLKYRKDLEGHALMLKMCQPIGYRSNGEPMWYGSAEDHRRLQEYCRQDVEVEREIFKRTLALSPTEQRVWVLDQYINKRGVPFDMPSIKAAVRMADAEKERCNIRMSKITGGAVTAVSALPALKEWAADFGVDTTQLGKYFIDELLTIEGLPEPVRAALELRREASRFTSIAKLDAILDREILGRVQYLFQYHATTTGRWAGRGVQPHNFTKDLPDPADVELILKAVKAAQPGVLEMFGPVAVTLSRLLRGFIAAPPGQKLLGGDWNSIEARGVAWLAGEDWKLKLFETGADVYTNTYARSFGIAPSEVSKAMRQIGKLMELAFGYQGGVGAFHSMSRNLGVHVDDLTAEKLKQAWRHAHPKIGELWRGYQAAAITAAQTGGPAVYRGVTFMRKGSFLLCRLPSQRVIVYPYPELRHDDYGPYLTFMGVPDAVKWAAFKKSQTEGTINQTSIVPDDRNTNKWARLKTYGGSLTENITQAICRDILAQSMLGMDAENIPVVLHVHDEIIALGNEKLLPKFTDLMVTPQAWAAGLPTSAGTWCAERYQK